MTTEVFNTELLYSETNRLERYLNTLNPEDWTGPTASEEWNVREIVVHLAGAAEAFSQRVRNALDENTSAPVGLPDAGEVNAASWADTNARRWSDISRSIDEDALAYFVRASTELNNLFVGLSSDDWDRPCYHPGGLMPLRTLAGLRLLELSVHHWDIASMRESRASLSKDILPALVQFTSEYLKWFFVPSERLDNPVTYGFYLDGADPRQWRITIESESARMVSAIIDPDVVIRCDAETFILAMCGRASLGSAMDTGDATVEGDEGLIHRFHTWFQGA